MNRIADLVDFLALGVDFDDVPALWSLVRAQPLIAAFTALLLAAATKKS